MPRQKNPKPQQCGKYSTDGDPLNEVKASNEKLQDVSNNEGHLTLCQMTGDVDEGSNLAWSISSENINAPNHNDTWELADFGRLADCWSPHLGFAGEATEEFIEESRTLLGEPVAFSHNKQFTEKKSKPTTGGLNPKVMHWLRKNFTMKAGSRLSASQVIQLYEKEFANKPTYTSLQNYQVGQLLRRIFPDIQRCKITVLGRRIWVYKDLHMIRSPHSDFIEIPPLNDRKPTSLQTNGGAREKGKRSSETVADSTNEMKPARNSALLYNLLYPSRGSRNDDKEIAVYGGVKRAGNRKKEDEIIEWLGDNYEYADGYFVKSANVLENYNRSGNTVFKYLSQVGRIIRHVFPQACHYRRSLKGGKREWVYHNIRPKNYTETDVWRGSTKHLKPIVKPTTRLPERSMSSLRRFTVNNDKLSAKNLARTSEDLFEKHKRRGKGRGSESDDDLWKREVREGSDNNSPADSNCQKPLFNLKRTSCSRSSDDISASTSPDQCNVFDKLDLESADARKASEQRLRGADLKSIVKISKRLPEGYEDSEHAAIKFHSQVSRSGSHSDKLQAEESASVIHCIIEASGSNNWAEDMSVKVKEEPASVAEDMSFFGTTKERERGKKRSCVEAFGSLSGDDVTTTDRIKPGSIKRSFSSSPHLPDLRDPAVDHNYSSAQTTAGSVRRKEFFEAIESNGPKRRSLSSVNFGLPNMERSVNRKRDNNNNAFIGRSASSPLAESGKFLRWEDLALCNYDKYGWSVTPTIRTVPCNYIEWVLFESQLLRDGQRVFRELKIYDDWSVSIHVMGKKVNPIEIGGITDLQRTKNSVEKVFNILATSRTCRGLIASCLSDLCANGIVVARPEIWSSRESDREELRHRAINCQILYRGNTEACIRCKRVIGAAHTPFNGIQHPGSHHIYPPRVNNFC